MVYRFTVRPERVRIRAQITRPVSRYVYGLDDTQLDSNIIRYRRRKKKGIRVDVSTKPFRAGLYYFF